MLKIRFLFILNNNMLELENNYYIGFFLNLVSSYLPTIEVNTYIISVLIKKKASYYIDNFCNLIFLRHF